jgi:hypothetical protein
LHPWSHPRELAQLTPVYPFLSLAYPTSPSEVPDLTNAINRRSQSTQQLLIKFLELSEKGARASSDELRERSAAEHKKVRLLLSIPLTYIQILDLILVTFLAASFL